MMLFDEEGLLADSEIDSDARNILDQNKDLTNLLRTLQKPWLKGDAFVGEHSIDGWLWKRKNRQQTWRKYWCCLVGNQIYYYSGIGNQKPKGMISISFISPPKNVTHDEATQLSSHSTSGFDIYGPHRVFYFIGENNETFDKFYKGIVQFLKDKMDKSDFEKRTSAASQIAPLLIQKSEIERERIYQILTLLERNGIFAGSQLSAREKGGKMEMETEDGVWHEYYFSLHGNCLYYYKTSKSPPKGCIYLPLASIVNLADETTFDFQIRTPAATFHLKNKHGVANSEWVAALQQAKNGSNNKSFSKEESDSDDDFVDLNSIDLNGGNNLKMDNWVRYLVYRTGSSKAPVKPEKKRFALPKKACSLTIGRSRDNDLVIEEDKKLSREHGKIESKDGVTFFFSDLGSSRGSKVNHKPATKTELKDGDTIKMGQTKMAFRVRAPKSKK